MVYVNEKGKVDISREGKFMSVMPPGNFSETNIFYKLNTVLILTFLEIRCRVNKI